MPTTARIVSLPFRNVTCQARNVQTQLKPLLPWENVVHRGTRVFRPEREITSRQLLVTSGTCSSRSGTSLLNQKFVLLPLEPQLLSENVVARVKREFLPGLEYGPPKVPVRARNLIFLFGSLSFQKHMFCRNCSCYCLRKMW